MESFRGSPDIRENEHDFRAGYDVVAEPQSRSVVITQRSWRLGSDNIDHQKTEEEHHLSYINFSH